MKDLDVKVTFSPPRTDSRLNWRWTIPEETLNDMMMSNFAYSSADQRFANDLRMIAERLSDK